MSKLSYLDKCILVGEYEVEPGEDCWLVNVPPPSSSEETEVVCASTFASEEEAKRWVQMRVAQLYADGHTPWNKT